MSGMAEIPMAMLRMQKKLRSFSARTARRDWEKMLISLFIDDDPVSDPDDPLCVGGDRRVVRDRDHGLAPFVHFCEKIHDLRGRLAVQLAGRFVAGGGFR